METLSKEQPGELAGPFSGSANDSLEMINVNAKAAEHRAGAIKLRLGSSGNASDARQPLSNVEGDLVLRKVGGTSRAFIGIINLMRRSDDNDAAAGSQSRRRTPQ